ncbi:MAG: hypothetical protein OXI81_00160 [Paracoccaceae bacterium]|nr:hypothetical protein [Paracoccaceae bacterium]MDE2912669.1 hypothetical protein [Paracoccaceae bacterium]
MQKLADRSEAMVDPEPCPAVKEPPADESVRIGIRPSVHTRPNIRILIRRQPVRTAAAWRGHEAVHAGPTVLKHPVPDRLQRLPIRRGHVLPAVPVKHH